MSLKLAILNGFIVLLALAFGYALSQFYFIATIVLGLSFLSFFTLQSLFTSEIKTAAYLIAAETAAMTLPLILNQKSYWLWAIWLGTFLLLLFAYNIGRWRLNNSLKISFSELRRHMLPIASFTIALFIIASYANIFSQQEELIVSRESVSVAARPIAPIISRFLPGFSIDSSWGEVLRSYASRVYGEKIDSEVAALQLREIVNNFADVRLRLDENIIDASQKLINAGLNQDSQQSRRIIFLTISTLLLFTIATGTFLINIVIAFLAWIIYRLLLVAGFAFITHKDTQKEVLNL